MSKVAKITCSDLGCDRRLFEFVLFLYGFQPVSPLLSDPALTRHSIPNTLHFFPLLGPFSANTREVGGSMKISSSLTSQSSPSGTNKPFHLSPLSSPFWNSRLSTHLKIIPNNVASDFQVIYFKALQSIRYQVIACFQTMLPFQSWVVGKLISHAENCWNAG